jgi:hypothetical protein
VATKQAQAQQYKDTSPPPLGREAGFVPLAASSHAPCALSLQNDTTISAHPRSRGARTGRKQEKRRDALPWRGEDKEASRLGMNCTTEGGLRIYRECVIFHREKGPRIFAIMPGFGSASTSGGGSGRPRLPRRHATKAALRRSGSAARPERRCGRGTGD